MMQIKKDLQLKVLLLFSLDLMLLSFAHTYISSALFNVLAIQVLILQQMKILLLQ